jgi:23S rRNA pseudouridine1911/1915/1917 synthase
VEKTYLAIVEGRPDEEGDLVHHLEHAGGSRKARVMDGAGNARLHFRSWAAGERYTLLEVVPQGGVFHQIRAQLAASGHPIKGDVKYGARRGEPDRSIGLHAWRMAFPYPSTGERVMVEAPLPSRSIWPVLAGLAGLVK